jgi:hypothetical protein
MNFLSMIVDKAQGMDHAGATYRVSTQELLANALQARDLPKLDVVREAVGTMLARSFPQMAVLTWTGGSANPKIVANKMKRGHELVQSSIRVRCSSV